MGVPIETIISFAPENKNDLIVVASGKGLTDNLILGSVSDAVIRKSILPVLIIKFAKND